MYEAFSGREFGPPPEANDGAQSHEDKDKKDKKKKPSEDGLPPVYGGQKQQARRLGLEQFWRSRPAPDRRPSLSDLLAADAEDKTRTQPGQKQAAEAAAEAADAATAPVKQEAVKDTVEAEETVSVPEAAQEVLEDVTHQLSDVDEALSATVPDSPEADAQAARAQFLERAIDELQPLAERSASAAGAAEQGASSPAAIEAAMQVAYRQTVEQIAPGQAAAEEQKVQEAMAAIEAAEAVAPAAGGMSEAAPVSPAEASAASDVSENAASSPSYTSSAARGAAGGAPGAGAQSSQAATFHAMAAPPSPPVFGARGYANAPQPVREVLVPVEQPRRPGEWIPPFIAGAVVMRLIDNRRLRRERKQHKAEMSNVLRKVDVMSARISQLGYEARQRSSQTLRAETVVPPVIPEAPARLSTPASEARQEMPGPARTEAPLAAPPAPERPVVVPAMPIYERRAAAAGGLVSSTESAAAPQERQPEYRTPVVLWQAESRQQPRPAEVAPATPAAPRAEHSRPQPPVPVERMSQQELMAAAAEITVDSVSLSSVFESHEVSERGLRRMVAEYYRGGDVRRILQQEKHIKELSYERDPRYRDQPMEAAQEPGGSAAPQQETVPAADAVVALSVPPPATAPSVTYDAAPAPLLLPPRPQPLLQRHRRTIQPALIIANAVAFVVLATLVVVLLVVYL